MLRLDQIKINCKETKDLNGEDILSLLKSRICKTKKCKAGDIYNLSIIKKSIDARKKPDIFYIYSVAFNAKNENIFLKQKKASVYSPAAFTLPGVNNPKITSPVIVGFGPAGIAAAYALSKAGLNPLIIERGSMVEKRLLEVSDFWEKGILNPDSNVQFGEGGAGAFSDGKLNTGNKDRDGLQQMILDILVKHGADPEIKYTAKPHIGTDTLMEVVKNLRNHIMEMGGSFRFNTRLSGIILDNQAVRGIEVIDTLTGNCETISTNTLILALGHSARDTFIWLKDLGVHMEAKPFAVGYRVIHPQSLINHSQYGREWEGLNLPAAPYKLVNHTKAGRAVYSFCMCPGGYVVNAQSSQGLCVNGMSYSKRDGKYANSAIVMAVDPYETLDFIKEMGGPLDEDLVNGPLIGMHFQELLEKRALEVGKGSIPYCRLSDFTGDSKGAFLYPQDAFKGSTSYIPGFKAENRILPGALDKAFFESMEYFSSSIEGFNDKDTIVSAVESRTSSPIRMNRDESFTALGISGLYPAGEGAGYAGGIMSAAADGVRTAAAIIKH